MAKSKFYAVKAGRKTGIFYNWDDCKKSVDGFSGARYKSFATMEEANEFLGIYTDKNNMENKKEVVELGNCMNNLAKKTNRESSINNISKPVKYTSENLRSKGNKYEKEINEVILEKGVQHELDINTEEVLSKSGNIRPIRSSADITVFKSYINYEELKDKYDLIAFVDGSYDKESQTYGSGVVVLDLENNNYLPYYCAGYDKWNQWNIVGELEATKLALKIAKEECKAKSVAIYHDLKNISLWASGEWQAKNEYTQDYVRTIERFSKELDICFVKVKAHSTESRYNDLADEAAKEAIIKYLG